MHCTLIRPLAVETMRFKDERVEDDPHPLEGGLDPLVAGSGVKVGQRQLP